MDDARPPAIVVVSHSAAIAEGLVAMAREVAGPDVRVLPAGGGPDGTLGTDGERVAQAIRDADTGGGVVVLADIGSAVLTVRAVLAEGMADGVHAALADAPLVEGAISAAVTASTGAPLEAVRAAAEEAWDVRKL